MKKSKILCLALTLLTLASGMLAISAFATEDIAPVIASKNISYDNDLKFVVAVPKASVKDTLTFTISDGEKSYSVSTAAADLESDSIKDPVIGGTPCYAIMSDLGVAFKDIAKVYTLTVSSGGLSSEPMTYSVAEYLYERLFKNEIILAEDGTPDADRKALYLSTLSMGADAEKVLYNLNADPTDDVTTFATEYFYSDISGEAKLYKSGDKITITSPISVYSYKKSGDAWVKTATTLQAGTVEISTHVFLAKKN